MMKVKPFKAILLDRDGVINHDSDEYIKSVEEWLPIDGSIDAIAELKRKGFIVAVGSNQSGLGRGYFDLNTLKAMHDKLHGLLALQGVALDRLYFCPHGPDDGCQCRKPKTAMLAQFALDFSLSPREILFIGDTKSDYDCAKAFGCEFMHVLSGKGAAQQSKLPHHTKSMADLAQIAAQLSAA